MTGAVAAWIGMHAVIVGAFFVRRVLSQMGGV